MRKCQKCGKEYEVPKDSSIDQYVICNECSMPNKQDWEEEFSLLFDKINCECESCLDKRRIEIKNFIQSLLSQKETEYREELLKVLNSEYEGTCETVLRVESAWKKLLDKRESEIRKETILAVLPEESNSYEEIGRTVSDNIYIDSGFNACRQSIIDSAKEKFNIDI